MQDAKFNVPADEKEVCLMGAIFNKHPKVAEVLLDYGVSPDTSDLDGSAAYKASKAGLTELVRKLIKAGADISGDTAEGRGFLTSALCAASQNGHFEIVEDLLKAGHDVRMQDSLLYAVENGHTVIVELLMGWGACEAEPINNHVLEMAAFSGTDQLVRRLLDSTPDGYDTSKVNNALLKACEAGRSDMIRLLVSRGAQPDRPIDFKYRHYKNDYMKLDWIEDSKIRHNCLVLAAQSGNEYAVQMLLDNEFDLSQVLNLKKELKVTTSIYVGMAFVRALLGCHQRVITTLLDAMTNHAYTDEIANLRAASEDHNQHILRGFSHAVDYDMRRVFPDFSWVVEKLHKLLLWKHRHMSQTLLKEAGVDLNFSDPLRFAVVNGHEQVVRLLLDEGVDVNSIVEGFGGHPKYPLLLEACSHKVTSDSIAHMLLDHGADYNNFDYLGETALHKAAENGRVTVVERLLGLGDLADKRTISGRTPLHVASNTDVIRALLAAGSNVNAINDDGWTPLHYAAQRGNPEGIELLLRYGANAHARTKDGRTALHLALEVRISFDRDILRTVNLLLDSGIDANVKDSKGLTPLHTACLPYNPNVLGQSTEKRSSSLHACLSYGVKIVGMLIDKGADVNALDNKGTSPFQMVTRRRVCQATIDIVSLLINHGANVNSQDNNGSTALHQVEESIVHADLLLDHGVIIDARDGKGETALLSSFERGHLHVARFLIDRGADINTRNHNGETMLHQVDGRNRDFCPFLLDREIDINALSIQGWSPLAYCLSSKWLPKKVSKLLVEKGGKNIRNWREEEYSLED
ncbi:uncharacterized protein FPRO_10445 [Fusarium proliferatum ET1]|uniref:Ankyrin n=1 Tax=Fusarium proliferatum (strain ET1) TaxID=1227346 RepID=A0A1L7VJV9_FUSPR|nr:uncharacterized protein FPRO_10445 [Fusarium proliferatum ET1]CZR40857.1 uncharacterized protein FPRO_10445 [Fusarium proliferatum ET1]